MKNLTIVSVAQSITPSITTSATTLGELKVELDNLNIPYDNSNIVVREGKVALISDDSVIPDNATTIMITPARTKAGLDSYDYEESHEGVLGAVEELSREIAQMKAELKAQIASLRTSINSVGCAPIPPVDETLLNEARSLNI